MPAAIAIAQVGRETKTPMIGLSPISACRRPRAEWIVTVAQPTQLMIDAVVERMKANGVKTVGYIGFTDAWGDLVYDALMKAHRAGRHQGRQPTSAMRAPTRRSPARC